MTLPLKHNRELALNPYLLAKYGVNERFFGARTIGAMRGIQADYDASFPSLSSRVCLTEVVDWPFSQDESGVPFNVSGIYGVRTRCWRDVDGGEYHNLVAVPRTLPAGYTRQGRCNILANLIDDHIGADPFNGAGLFDSYYTPKTVYWRGPNGRAPWPDGYSWTPMNLNQQVVTPPISSGVWYFTGGAPGGAYIKSFIGNHIGFRGLLVSVTYPVITPPDAPAPAGTWTFMVGWCDPANPPPATIADINVLWSRDVTFDGAGTPGTTVDIPITVDLFPATLTNKRMDYYWIIHQVFNFGEFANGIIKLSPRTDVPLWYFASTGTKCAPGGVLL